MVKKEVTASGWRKTARAIARIREGHGRVLINGVPLEIYTPAAMRHIILIPLILAEGLVKKVDIEVSTWGGGFSGQAQAAAMSIARGLVEWSKSEDLKKAFITYDRHLLVGDSRQTEPKKFGGPGPRRRRQKSYR